MTGFSKIDLVKGFYQIPLHEDYYHKTAFCTPMGKFHFKYISIGLKNAPKYFNAKISDLLPEFKNVFVFVDDVLIFSENEEEHLNLLEKVLNKFIECNIQINTDK